MKMNRTPLLGLLAATALLAGCATPKPPPRLSYLAAKRPEGPIKSQEHLVGIKTKRAGFYVMNNGFRPAPDVGAYVRDAQSQADSAVLRNADVELVVPAALDILFFGFQFGNDTTSASY